MKDFTETFMINSLTPYLHCFICHMHQFRFIHGDFNLFNIQGLEKLNDITSEQVFKSKNIKRKELRCVFYLHQRMHKRYRMDINENIFK